MMMTIMTIIFAAVLVLTVAISVVVVAMISIITIIMLFGESSAYLMSRQHAKYIQKRICLDNLTCCHSEIAIADQNCRLSQPKDIEVEPDHLMPDVG